MGRCYNSTVINAPAQQVWQTVRDFHNMDWAAPVITDLKVVGTIDGGEPGARRILNDAFHETLKELDEVNFSVTYSIDDGPGPLATDAVEQYVGKLKLHPVTDHGQTFAAWEARYLADDDAAVGEFCNPVYVALLAALKAHFDRHTAIQDHYDPAFQICYGCGSQNAHGLQLKSYWDGQKAVAECLPDEKYLGVPGFVYGGLIASLIDCHGIATAAAMFRERQPGQQLAPRMVTGSLQVSYIKPTPLGDQPLQLCATISEASDRKAVVQVELGVAGAVTARGEVIAVRIPDNMNL